MSPRICVVLPVYNCRRFLREALESLRVQTENNFECLIVDDGSADGSLEMSRKFAAHDQRFRVIELEHGGIVMALNRGLELARAPLLARMDADDIALPERLEQQVKRMQMEPEMVALGGAALMVDPKNRPIADSRPPLQHEDIMSLLARGKGSAMIHPTLIVRTEVVRRVGGYRESYRHIEDLDLYWRLGQIGKLGNLSETVLRYRQHPASANLRHAEAQAERTGRWLREVAYRDAPEQAPTPQFYRPHSRAQLHADWAAKALTAGYLKTCRIHAFNSIVRRPFNGTAWRVFASSLFRSIRSDRIRKP